MEGEHISHKIWGIRRLYPIQAARLHALPQDKIVHYRSIGHPVDEQGSAFYFFTQPKATDYQIPVDVPTKVLPKTRQGFFQFARQDVPLLRPAIWLIDPACRSLSVCNRLRRFPWTSRRRINILLFPLGRVTKKAWIACFCF